LIDSDNARPVDGRLRATAQIAKRPIHPMLVPFPIVCFVGALATDIVYANTAEMMWADFSTWLLVIGMVMGVLAGVAGLIDFLGNRVIRALPAAWLHMIGNLIALLLALFNTLVHTRDAWTSVVPVGLILSAIVVLILCVTGGWAGRWFIDTGSERSSNVVDTPNDA
jgi:uncharacterized membrane protein